MRTACALCMRWLLSSGLASCNAACDAPPDAAYNGIRASVLTSTRLSLRLDPVDGLATLHIAHCTLHIVLHIVLHIAHCTLYCTLQAFAAPEMLRGANGYSCDVCARAAAPVAAGPYTAQDARRQGPAKTKTQYTAQDARCEEDARQPALRWGGISKMPQALTLHLKRGGVASGAAGGKIATAVPFPMTLDLTPFGCAPVKHVSEISQISQISTVEAEHLKLYAVVEHQGVCMQRTCTCTCSVWSDPRRT